MPLAGADDKEAVFDLEDDAVLLVDADAPPAGVIATKRFWAADAGRAVALNALDELVDAPKRLSVMRLPLDVIGPSRVKPKLFHGFASELMPVTGVSFRQGHPHQSVHGHDNAAPRSHSRQCHGQ